MSTYVEIINKILALGTIGLQAIIVAIVIALIFFRNKENPFLIFVKEYTFILGFITALGTFLLSIFYSNIVGFPPCELCWIQRIFLYPQLILFGIELYKRDHSIVDFSMVFAIIGSIVSAYHLYIENGGASNISCAALTPVNVTQVSCITRYVYEFGYVTMPLMALTSSLFIIVILVNYKYMAKVK